MISEGIGSGLYFQNGPNPLTDAVPVPSDESTIQQTLWGQGKCVPRLGGSTSNLKYHLHPSHYFTHCERKTRKRFDDFAVKILKPF